MEFLRTGAHLDQLDAAIRAQEQRLQQERRARSADRARLQQAKARLQRAQTNARAIRARLRQTAKPDRPVADSRQDVQNLQTDSTD
jgi:hypothetical protein